MPMRLQLSLDFIADGFDLRRAETGAQQKIIGERGKPSQIEQRHFRCLLFLRRLDGCANVRVEANLFLASPVKGLLVNVFLDARRHKPMNGLLIGSRRWRTSVAETWLETVSSTIDRRAAQRDRARIEGAWAAPRPRKQFRRNHQAQRVHIESRDGWPR